ncbi:ubiquitin-conjugating enzyme E2, putative [Leishmania tarentolae]|uniref:Ubiquitin-conjugating enzyme E2, putative n=1 Tax=Leishmania tarentolae TaxID=5689 RepID=A0A640KN12_LEITA|nr:ubiquitin-conjugating enzyme E2, putative [Leishmania tarentolae]
MHSGGNSSGAAARLQKELIEVMMSDAEGISAYPEDDNLFRWIGSVKGVTNTPYEELEYNLLLVFPPNYPYEAPTVTFITPCFHPNVDTRGAICLDILKEKWSAVYSVSSILLSIQNLLNNPNNESPLNNHAAQLWQDREQFTIAVRATHGGAPGA